MHHRFRMVFGDNFVESGSIKNVTTLERSPLHRPLMTGAEIVVDDWKITGLVQRFACVRADIARPTSHENRCRRRRHNLGAHPIFRSAAIVFTRCWRPTPPRPAASASQ